MGQPRFMRPKELHVGASVVALREMRGPTLYILPEFSARILAVIRTAMDVRNKNARRGHFVSAADTGRLVKSTPTDPVSSMCLTIRISLASRIPAAFSAL
eukprot:1468974-Rhodomonas_salina.2